MIVGIGREGAANEHAALRQQEPGTLKWGGRGRQPLIDELVNRAHVRLTSERSPAESDHARSATREHRKAFSPFGVTTRDVDRFGERGECLVAVKCGFVVATHFLVTVHPLLVVRREGDGHFVELDRTRCRKPASRHAPRRDQGIERPTPDLLAPSCVRQPGEVGVLPGDSVVVVVGDELRELVGAFPGDRLDPRAHLCMRPRPARLRQARVRDIPDDRVLEHVLGLSGD